MVRTIRWGIIGVGDVTEVKSGPAFHKTNNSALVAVMRRNADLAKDYAERHDVSHWYSDAEALINDPEVDAVYIATPPHVHKAYTLMCAEVGKPVYVEKPMALNFAECQDMIAACAERSVPLWVAYYRRAQPRFNKIKELITSGAIGTVCSVHSSLYRPPAEFDPTNLPWRYQPAVSGGGLFIDVGSHTLNLLAYFFGAIVEVKGFAANQGSVYPAEDHVVANFVFENGVLGSGVWCFNSCHNLDRTELVGIRGKITFAVFDNMPTQLVNDEGEQQITIAQPAHVQQPLIQTIVDELNGEGTCPSTADSGAHTTWVIDQILADYRKANPL